MSALPYMPLYIADYMADAAHLSTEEHGAYLLLIMTYWQRGKALPSDPDRLANIARMSNERWASVERTISEFFIEKDGEWRHGRVEAELAKVRDKSEKARAAGKASGERRSSKPATGGNRKPSVRSTDVERTLNHTESDTESDTKTLGLPSSATSARVIEDLKNLNNAFGRRNDKTRTRERVVTRAEGLGLDVAGLTDACNRHKPRNRSAYFTALCVQRLRDLLPRVDEELLRSALWDADDTSYRAVMNLLMVVA